MDKALIKVARTINSCTDQKQFETAGKLVHNYLIMYGFNRFIYFLYMQKKQILKINS